MSNNGLNPGYPRTLPGERACREDKKMYKQMRKQKEEAYHQLTLAHKRTYFSNPKATMEGYRKVREQDEANYQAELRRDQENFKALWKFDLKELKNEAQHRNSGKHDYSI